MDDTINYLSSHAIRMLTTEEVATRALFTVPNNSNSSNAGITASSIAKKDNIISSNKTVGVTYGMLWIDVEGSQVWNSIHALLINSRSYELAAL